MAEPVLIYAYEEAEKGVPLSDEDVARGFLEDGWVPVLNFNYPYYQHSFSVPADAPTGALTFFECMWPVRRYPCGAWVANAARKVNVRKTCVPIQEDEELFVEPIAIEDVREGMVIACKATVAPAIAIDHVAVCCGRTVDGPRVRRIGHPIGRVATHSRNDVFVVCKRFREPFVLK